MLYYIVFLFFGLISLCSSSVYAITPFIYNTTTTYSNFINNNYYWWKNNNILNIAPYLSINGLDNRNINFYINGVQYKFLSSPLSSTNFINPFFISHTEVPKFSFSNLVNEENNINLIEAKDFNDIHANFIVNTEIIFPNIGSSNNIVGCYKSSEFNLLLGVNYIYLKNALEHNFSYITPLPTNNYNSIIVVEYEPLDKNSSLKLTNVNSTSNYQRDISFSKDALIYFNQDIIYQQSENNLTIISYHNTDPDNLIWNYSSNILFGVDLFNVNKNNNIFKKPSISHNNFQYNAQNISQINLFYNSVELTYGLTYSKLLINSHTSDNKSLWTIGKEDNYNLFFKSDINLLEANKVHFIPEIVFDYAKYKANGLHSYTKSGVLPSFSIQIYPMANIMLYGKYVYNARLPHIYEKYIEGDYFYNDNFVKFNSNPDLKNEKKSTFKVGTIYNYTSNTNDINVNADINLFLSKVTNYIDYFFISANKVQYKNINKASFSGYETRFLVQLYNLNFNLSYNYINGIDEDGNYLMNLYPSKLSLDTSYKFSGINLKPGVKISVFNRFNRFNNNFYSYNKIKGFTLFDIYIEYKNINNKLGLTAGVENIFNKKYNLPYINAYFKDRTYFFNFTLKL